MEVQAPATPVKHPKVVERVKAALSGQAVTPDSIKTMLSATLFNQLGNSFRQHLSAEAKDTYLSLKSDDDRRSYMAQFVLDPSIAKTNGFNRDFAFDQAIVKETQTWWTREQLGGPTGLNNLEHADILIASGSLPSKPHEVPALAEAGIVQYHWRVSSVEKQTGHRSEAGTTAKSELKEHEYTEAKNHIPKSFGDPKGIKRKASTNGGKKEETQEEKRLKTSNTARASALRKLKQATDKYDNELRMRSDDLPKLEAKGYPPQMVDFFRQKIALFNAEVGEATTIHASEVVRPLERRQDFFEVVDTATVATNNALQTLETHAAAFKKSVTADLKQLTG